LGALDGGLKMMWSCGSVFEGANNGSGFTLRAFRVRLKVDLFLLHAAQTKLAPLLGIKAGLNGIAKKGDVIAALCWIDNGLAAKKANSTEFRESRAAKSRAFPGLQIASAFSGITTPFTTRREHNSLVLLAGLENPLWTARCILALAGSRHCTTVASMADLWNANLYNTFNKHALAAKIGSYRT
jgi:hypothetical protein